MGSKFFSKSRDNDDDDLLEKQLSVLGEKNDKITEETQQIHDEYKITADKRPEQKASAPAINIDKKSIIQKDLVLTGAISAGTSIDIYGIVNGNIDCKKDINISGTVKGNIKAESIEVMGGKITGDVDCQGTVTIINGSEVHGNIKGKSITCDGKVEGNTSVGGKAEIRDNAVILGDIDCGCISIREGAVCNGNIQTSDKKKRDEPAKIEKAVDKKINTDLKQYI